MSIDKKAERALKEVLYLIGPMFPGKITEQYISCGKKVCKCKQVSKPQKHGPYHQLSWSIKGKRSTMHVTKNELISFTKRIKRYEKFKKWMDDFFYEELIEMKKEKKYKKDKK